MLITDPINRNVKTQNSVIQDELSAIEAYVALIQLVAERMRESEGYYGTDADPNTFSQLTSNKAKVVEIGKQHKVTITDGDDREIEILLETIKQSSLGK